MTAISHSPALERVARVLAAQRLSGNAKGDDPSAGPEVDQAWRGNLDDATAVLKTLREPDQAMAAAGDAAVWERMVLAALGAPSARPDEPPPAGTDPLHEGP